MYQLMVMSNIERESPRARIKSWLLRANNGLDRASAEKIGAKRINSKSRNKASSCSHHPARASYALQSTEDQKTSEYAINHGSKDRHHSPRPKARYAKSPNKHEAEETAPNLMRYERSNAERLGLDEPFQKLVDEGKLNACGRGRPGKRRRRASSTSSNLQPAPAAQVERSPSFQHKAEQIESVATSRYRVADRVTTPLPYESNHSTMLFSSPKQVVRAYERQPRHRTREDRYEIKPDTKRRRKKDSSDPLTKEKKQAKKRSHKLKSGEVLMHEFAAPNVPQERLTLRAGKSSGIFGNGKASSPVKRKGLPDLAFSELAFLRHSSRGREEPSNKSIKANQRMNEKSQKFMDLEADISHYFLAHKARKHPNQKKIEMRDERHAKQQNASGSHEPSPAVLDLPDTPFLGFGSSGAYSDLPSAVMKEADAKYIPEISRRHTGSSSRSTTYFTWSQSRAPLSIPGSQERVRLLPSRPSSEKSSTGIGRTSHRDSVPRDLPLATSRGAPIPTDWKVTDPVQRNLSNLDSPTDHHPTTNQADPDHFHKAEGQAESKIPNSEDYQVPKIASAAAVTEQSAHESGGLSVEESSKAQKMTFVDPSRAQATTSQLEVDLLKRTFNSLIQVCKDKLSEIADKKAETMLQSDHEEASNTIPGHSNQVKDVGCSGATQTSNILQEEEVNNPLTATHPSYNDPLFRAFSDVQHKNQFSELPSALKTNHVIENKETSRDLQTSLARIQNAPKLAVDIQEQAVENEAHYHVHQENLIYDPMRMEDFAFDTDKGCGNRNERNWYPQITNSALIAERPAFSGVSPHQVPAALVDAYLGQGDQGLASEPAHDQSDLVLGSESVGYSKPYRESPNINYQAAEYRPFSAYTNDPSRSHSGTKVPQTSCSEISRNFNWQTSNLTDRGNLLETDRPRSSSIYSALDQRSVQFPFSNALPSTHAQSENFTRGFSRGDLPLVDFWKPNKLY